MNILETIVSEIVGFLGVTQAWDILKRERNIDREDWTGHRAPMPLHVHAVFAEQCAKNLR
jgi:hypothetical protein